MKSHSTWRRMKSSTVYENTTPPFPSPSSPSRREMYMYARSSMSNIGGECVRICVCACVCMGRGGGLSEKLWKERIMYGEQDIN